MTLFTEEIDCTNFVKSIINSKTGFHVVIEERIILGNSIFFLFDLDT